MYNSIITLGGENMSSNPMTKIDIKENVILDSKPMTISGTINKTAILLGIVVFIAYYTWTLCAQGYTDKANIFLTGGIIAGFLLAITTIFNPKISPFTAPMYAVCEGLALGIISYSYGSAFDGIIQNAIGITILALFSMLFLYKTKAIQATETFKKVIFTSTLAVAIFYLVGINGALMGHPMTLFNGGALGIGVSLLICAIAAFNFIMDFDFIEQGEKRLYPSHFEWYGGFTLLVTLIWLYLEVLRLLAQLNSRD